MGKRSKKDQDEKEKAKSAKRARIPRVNHRKTLIPDTPEVEKGRKWDFPPKGEPWTLPFNPRPNKEQCTAHRKLLAERGDPRDEAKKKRVRDILIEYIGDSMSHYNPNERKVITESHFQRHLKCKSCNRVTSRLIQCRPYKDNDPTDPRHSICFDCVDQLDSDSLEVRDCPFQKRHNSRHVVGYFTFDFEPLVFDDYKAIGIGIVWCDLCSTYVDVRMKNLHPDTCSGRHSSKKESNESASTTAAHDSKDNSSREKTSFLEEESEETRLRAELRRLRRNRCQSLLEDSESNDSTKTNQPLPKTTPDPQVSQSNESQKDDEYDLSPVAAADTTIADESIQTDRQRIQELEEELRKTKDKLETTQRTLQRANACLAVFRRGFGALDYKTMTSVAGTINAMIERVEVLVQFAGINQNEVFQKQIQQRDLMHYMEVVDALAEARLYRQSADPPSHEIKEFVINPFKNRKTARIHNPERFAATITVFDKRFPEGSKDYEIDRVDETVGSLRAKIAEDLKHPLNSQELFLVVTGSTYYGSKSDEKQIQDIMWTAMTDEDQRGTLAIQLLTSAELSAVVKPGRVPRKKATFFARQTAVFEGPPTRPAKPVDLISACQQEMELREMALINRNEQQIDHYFSIFEQMGRVWVAAADKTKLDLQNLLDMLKRLHPSYKAAFHLPDLNLSWQEMFPWSRWGETSDGKPIPPALPNSVTIEATPPPTPAKEPAPETVNKNKIVGNDSTKKVNKPEDEVTEIPETPERRNTSTPKEKTPKEKENNPPEVVDQTNEGQLDDSVDPKQVTPKMTTTARPVGTKGSGKRGLASLRAKKETESGPKPRPTLESRDAVAWRDLAQAVPSFAQPPDINNVNPERRARKSGPGVSTRPQVSFSADLDSDDDSQPAQEPNNSNQNTDHPMSDTPRRKLSATKRRLTE